METNPSFSVFDTFQIPVSISTAKLQTEAKFCLARQLTSCSIRAHDEPHDSCTDQHKESAGRRIHCWSNQCKQMLFKFLSAQNVQFTSTWLILQRCCKSLLWLPALLLLLLLLVSLIGSNSLHLDSCTLTSWSDPNRPNTLACSHTKHHSELKQQVFYFSTNTYQILKINTVR